MNLSRSSITSSLLLILVSVLCFQGIVANELTLSAIDSAYVTDLNPADKKNYGVDEVYIASHFDETASETGDRTFYSEIAYYFDSNAFPSFNRIKNIYLEATVRTCGAENYFRSGESNQYELARKYVGDQDQKCGLHELRVLLDKSNMTKAQENTSDKERFAIVIQVKPNGSTLYFGANNENVDYIPRMVVEMSQEESDIELKLSGPDQVSQGASADFQAVISNLGGSVDNSVTFNVEFPEGFSLASINSGLPSFSCDNLPCSLPEIAPSESISLDVGFTVSPLTPFGETEITGIAQTERDDVNPDNNIDVLVLNVTEPFNQTDQCLNITNCDSCVAQEFCGWCADTEECIPVSDFNEIDECDVFYLDSCDSCDDIPQLFEFGGEMNHPPEPQVNIHYNPNDQKFHFTVDAAYLRERSSYFIDFVKFNYPSNGEYEVTNCENRETNWKQSRTEDFHKQWLSAAHAHQPGALGTSQFKAYGPSGIWQLESMSCDKIQYSTALTLSDMLTCQDREGTPSVAFNHIPGTSIAELSGELYVSIVIPVDPESGPSEGFTVLEYRYPFTFQFNLELSHSVSISGVAQEDVSNFISMKPMIESYGINDHKLLELNLKTRLEGAEGAHLDNPSVLSIIPVSVSTRPKLECEVPCEQEWKITSEQALQDYIDDYQVSWKITNCNAQGNCEDSGRTAKLKMSLALSHPIQQMGKDDFEAQISVHNSLDSSEVNQGPYEQGDFVFLKKELVLNKNQENSYHLMIENVWICYPSVSSYTPVWDPENDHYGCSQAHGKELPESNILQIIKEGSPERKGKAAAFEAQIHSPQESVLPHWSSAGVSMKAQPMTSNDRTYMVHIESTIVPRYDDAATGWKTVTLLRSDNALTMVSIKGSGDTTDRDESNEPSAVGSWASPSCQLHALGMIMTLIFVLVSLI
eukprot:gb/GECH01000566.1/.p1 GENE.gb/GECH01000566.1/~~gb/GECH01000566.1/.p1  ORF type:complete len:925 (+),score=251.57 gb/GECH01000566.1/:1-2775(+)